MRVAIVPARKGSKGLPGKNLRPLLGLPLVGYPVIAAQQSGRIDCIICTSDCPEILATARQWGAEYLIRRPDELAQDDSLISDVLQHAISTLETEHRIRPDSFVMLEPTSPLTKGEDIDLACDYMEQFGASSAVALRRVKEASPSRLLVLTEAGRVKPAVRGDSYPLQGRRQDIEPYFLLAGSYYLSKVEAYIQHQSFLHKATLGIELPPWKTLEIDEEFDFFLAEQVVRSWVATDDV